MNRVWLLSDCRTTTSALPMSGTGEITPVPFRRAAIMFTCAQRVPNAAAANCVNLSLVTGGWGTTSQTTASLGTFSYSDTGSWQTYVWMPLLNNGSPVAVNGGAVETFRATTLKGGFNVNNYMLVATNAQLIPPQSQTRLQVAGQTIANGPGLTVSLAREHQRCGHQSLLDD